MKIVKQAIYIALVAVLIFAFAACGVFGGSSTQERNVFTCFTDIPGVTLEEIQAIEQLRLEHNYFIFGMLHNDEAFYTIDGEIAGFSARLCDWLTELFGIPFVPAIFEWVDLIDGLESGDIHFTGLLARTEERSQIYAMTDSISKRALTLVRAPETESLKEIMEERPLRFAFYKATALPEVLADSGFFGDFEVVNAGTQMEAAELVLNNEVDGFIGDGTLAPFLLSPSIVTETLSPLVFTSGSFASQNPALTPIVDVVQKALENNATSFLGELYARGMADSRQHRVAMLLCDYEKEFIANNPVINIVTHSFGYPISFYNEFERAFQGLAFDILKEVELTTGLSFNIITQHPELLPDALEMIYDGQAHLIAGVIRPGIIPRITQDFLWSTPIFSDRYALLSSADFPNIGVNEVMYASVALIGGSAYDRLFTGWFPHHTNIVRYTHLDYVLAALENGEVDLAFSSQAGLLRLINFRENIGFRANIFFDEPYDIHLAVCGSMPLLHSIINKSLTVIDTDVISDEWMSRTFDYSVRILQAQRPFLIGASVLLVLVLLLVLHLFNRNRSENRRLNTLVAERTSSLEMESTMLETLLEAIPDILFCKDLDLKYTRLNKSFEVLFGRDRKKIVGLDDMIALDVPIELATDWRNRDIEVLSQKKIDRSEELVPAADGSLRMFETMKTPIIVNNTIVGLLGISRDITNRKKIEDELRKASQAKSDFLARMSHEIRTPITAVMGISEIQLQNPDLPPIIEESFAKIHNSSNILLGIINDILDLSKIEAGKMILLCEEYDVASMISDVAHMHLAYVGSKNIEFRMNVNAELPAFLIGDSLRIGQILNNIMSNAFKYTESGTVELSLRHLKNEENHVTLIATISDTGMGMTKPQLDALYNEYTRFHERENRHIIGTGLGMPIVYRLAQMMNAQIEIESEVGKGTSVIVHIPQGVSGLEILGEKTVLQLQQFEVSTHTAAKRFDFTPEPMPYGSVLVVDDVEANLYVAQGLLAFYDLNIETCENGHEAIEKIKQGKMYDIIFMDQMMPGINGTETMRIMRDMGYMRPIAALTANALIGQAEALIREGFDGFISKPIQTKHLNTILIKHIRDKQSPEVIEAAALSHASKERPSNEGIESFRNRPDVMERLRMNFVLGQKNTFSNISQALNAGNIENAHLLTHTLKGLAGLMDENALEQIADNVEQLLESGKIPSNEQLSALENELMQVLDNIAVNTPKSTTFSNNNDFDKTTAIALLDKLDPLLEAHNPDSLDLLDGLREIPEAAILIRQIEGFDFVTALKTISILRDILSE
ncbi:MAG: response regulator [Defluviitaleaceae bacterium]|nr:response regulator [Defluviitaleaceae bacterium]